jgi:hypothetical protein
VRPRLVRAMKVLRVFPRKTSLTPTDMLAFIGDPPLWRPEADEVHISVTFTWDIDEGERLAAAWSNYYPVVRLGGPAFASPCNRFEPGRYIKPGVTFTTRGCNNCCSWCLVPEREGRLIEYGDFAPGHIVQDNNLLQASRSHIRRVFAMLKSQRRAATLSGGLDARLVGDWLVEELRGVRIAQLFLAADTKAALKPLEKALKKLSGLNRQQLRVYALLAFGGESISEAKERLETIWQLGGMPFAQLYQPADRFIKYSPEWRRLARRWQRPAIMKIESRRIAQTMTAERQLELFPRRCGNG